MNDQIVYNRIDEAEKDPATGRLNRPQLEVLVAALQENDITLAERMNLSTEAIICNQCQEVSYREFRRRNRRIRTLSFNERGSGATATTHSCGPMRIMFCSRMRTSSTTMTMRSASCTPSGSIRRQIF